MEFVHLLLYYISNLTLIDVQRCVCVCVYIYIYMYVCVYMYIYIYMLYNDHITVKSYDHWMILLILMIN